ncbi:DNA helicase [Streptococcus himalayensis]|uniref:DNA helicase n=1 Tax=Streptococcus himalayensis TaxID=1888195 RepID=A0A917A5L5_9STRE|nr:DNA helicase [Streptococcus himalayensis]GGE29103.1 DNA helicase [Streptococcus himalayensis]
MKPNDSFSFVKNNIVSKDTSNLVRLYLPILGIEATMVYQYFLAFGDNGEGIFHFSHILNHLNFGMDRLKQALDLLVAFDLLDWYEVDSQHRFFLREPLSAREFLENAVYRRLLEKKIGEIAVESLLVGSLEGEKRTLKLSQLMDVPSVASVPTTSTNDFDINHFKELMARDFLRFKDEKEDLLALFAIADQKSWTWYETYLLAKETAVGQVISVQRMAQKLNQVKVIAEFSSQEKIVIDEAKSKSSIEFLAEIKEIRRGTIVQSERKCLEDMADLGLLDEVINVILLLTFNVENSANLAIQYAMKVANDFAYQRINSAEAAVLRIRERNQKVKERKEKRQPQPQTNVPKWSNPDYKNETSKERQAELEEQKRRLLAKLDQGGE